MIIVTLSLLVTLEAPVKNFGCNDDIMKSDCYLKSKKNIK